MFSKSKTRSYQGFWLFKMMFTLLCTVQLEKTGNLQKKCSRHLIDARECVNKNFVHSGSIGLIWGKHARYVITSFFSLIFSFYSHNRPNRKGETARTCSLMNSLPRQLFIPSSSPWAINRPISLLPSIICPAPNVWVLQENENAPQHSCKGNTPANAWSAVPKVIYCLRYCFLLTKDCMNNEVWGCAETLPKTHSFQLLWRLPLPFIQV